MATVRVEVKKKAPGDWHFDFYQDGKKFSDARLRGTVKAAMDLVSAYVRALAPLENHRRLARTAVEKGTVEFETNSVDRP